MKNHLRAETLLYITTLVHRITSKETENTASERPNIVLGFKEPLLVALDSIIIIHED